MSNITESFRETFAQAYENGEFNGVVLVAENGKVLYKEAMGIAEIENEEELTTRAIFNLASVSKQFTALCIMLLQEEGKLSYDDTIDTYLPELPYSNITIRHLLHHTSGLAEYEVIIDDYWEENSESDFITNDDLLKVYAEQQFALDFEPDTQYEYSNTGYAFLASIVERASEMSFEAFIKNRVFEPLGMKDSFALRRPSRFPKPIAQGFTLDDDDEYEDYTFNYMDGIVGDGNVYSSAEDLAKYAHALMGGKIVSRETLDKAFTPAETSDGTSTDYGFGWEIYDETFISHEGLWEAYNTYLAIDLKNKWVFVVLDNGDHIEVHSIIGEALGKIYK